MKKLLSFIIVLFTLFLYIMPTTYASIPLVTDSYILGEGLGRSINVATSRYAHPDSVILGSNVINPAYLNSLNLDRMELSGSFVNEYHEGNSLNSYYLSKKTTYEQAASLSGSYELFTGSISSSFQAAISSSYYEKIGQYYSTNSLVTKTVKAALPNYLDNISQYRSNLNSTFINNCYKLNYGLMTYDEFVQMYGTHLIASAVFGGKVDLNYTITSSTRYISDFIGTQLQEKIELGIIGFQYPSMNFQTSVNTSDLQQILTSNATLNFFAESIGGYGFSETTNQGNLTSSLQSWISSVHSNPELIEYNPNGLVPLWDLVPTAYSNAKNILQNNLNGYIQSVNDELSYSPSISVDSQLKRSSEVTVTDSGRFSNPYDNIQLSSSGYTYNNLLLRGIDNVHLIVEIDVREVDDGYQYIFLYDGHLSTSNLLGSYQFEHGSGFKKTSYNSESEPYVFIFTIPLTELSDSFTIRYGASGNYSDTWKNKNLRLSYMFY